MLVVEAGEGSRRSRGGGAVFAISSAAGGAPNTSAGVSREGQSGGWGVLAVSAVGRRGCFHRVRPAIRRSAAGAVWGRAGGVFQRRRLSGLSGRALSAAARRLPPGFRAESTSSRGTSPAKLPPPNTSAPPAALPRPARHLRRLIEEYHPGAGAVKGQTTSPTTEFDSPGPRCAYRPALATPGSGA